MHKKSPPPHESHVNLGVGSSNLKQRKHFSKSSLEILVDDFSKTHSRGYFRHLPILYYTRGRMLLAKPWKGNLYNGLYLHHANVALNHSMIKEDDVEIFIHNDFARFLSSYSGSTRRFFRLDVRGRVLGMTLFLKNTCLQILNAVQYISDIGIVHNNLSSLDSVVLSEDDTAMIYDFSHSRTSASHDYVEDVKGLGGLLDNLLQRCGMLQSDLPPEIRHLIYLLKEYYHISVVEQVIVTI